MAAIDSKFHIKIGDYGFMLAKQVRADRHIYGREEAPSFVNKVSSGDPNYRDSSFFPHLVQNNWLNGFDQEKFNDGGKFYRSSGLDITGQEKLQLAKNFSLAGTPVAGVNITAQEAWRASISTLFNDANFVAYYKGEDLTDSKGANTLTNNNSVAFSSAKFGNGFDGGSTDANKSVSVANKLSYAGGAYSISLWVKIAVEPGSGTSYDLAELVDSVTDTTLLISYINPSGTRQLQISRVRLGVAGDTITHNVDLGILNFHHIVLTYDGSTVRGYLDNVSIGSVASSGSGSSAGTDGFHILEGRTANTNNTLGIIDDVGCFSRELTATEVSTAYNNELVNVSPVGSNFTHIVGTSGGKIYSWDGVDTYTELFDCRRLKWFDTVASKDTDYYIGDQAGTERAQAQSFQLDAATRIKAVQLYIKVANGTPSDLQVRIETNNAGVPSGTLADTNLSKTFAVAGVSGTYAFVTVEFDTVSSAALAASTTFWIVTKTAAVANDQNYNWGADASSPSYSGGNRAHSADGGSSWTADTAADFLFRILGESASINALLISDVTGTRKLYIGVGDPTGTNNGNARLYSTSDISTFVLTKTFNTTDESSVLSLIEYGSSTRKVYIGLGSRAKIYSTTDMSTFTLSKTITVPSNPGYIFAMVEYSGRLYVAGGFPEQLNNNNSQYGGFLYSYDEFSWTKVGEFEHTVIKSLEVYDNLLFLGTIKRRFYVYNTASIDKLLDLPWDVQITSMKKWDDKLALALAPTPGASISGQEGIYLFDRNGFHNAFSVSSRGWYSVFVFNNNIMGGNDDGQVYQTSQSTYQASGTLQMSYFEASLPSIDKLWRSLILHFEALPTGGSITVDYKTDESDASWTSLGSYSTVGGITTTLTFPVAFYSKKISLRITVTTSTNTNTPVLKVVDLKYVIVTDFKYLWKMKIVCPDNIIWLDGSQPISTAPSAILVGATTLPLADADGFPTAGRGVVIDAGVEDEFTWTGKSGDSLTGCSGLLAHTSTGLTVKITGKMMHKQLLVLKQAKTLYTFTDIDELTYTVLFHQYQADDFVVNQTDGLENNAPITLLEA